MSWADFTRNDYSEPMPNGKTFYPIPPGFVQFEPAILKDVCEYEHDSDDGCVTRASGGRDPIGCYMSGGVATADADQITPTVGQLDRKQDAPVRIVKLKVGPSNRRHTNTGRDTSGRVQLDVSARRRRYLPIKQKKLPPGEHIRTEAMLASAIYVGGDITSIQAIQQGPLPRKVLRLTTQREDKVIAMQLYDRVDKKSSTLCHLPKGDVILEVRLFEDRYCIDIVEGNGNQFIKRWCFFLATNTRLQALCAKNLWNHLCSAFSIMPDRMLRSMSLLTENPQLPYNFRNNTLEQRIDQRASTGGGIWTVDLETRQQVWNFTGFFGRNQKRLEKLTNGHPREASDDEDTSPPDNTQSHRRQESRGRGFRGRNKGKRQRRGGR